MTDKMDLNTAREILQTLSALQPLSNFQWELRLRAEAYLQGHADGKIEGFNEAKEAVAKLVEGTWLIGYEKDIEDLMEWRAKMAQSIRSLTPSQPEGDTSPRTECLGDKS